jgi:hypothetical protein
MATFTEDVIARGGMGGLGGDGLGGGLLLGLLLGRGGLLGNNGNDGGCVTPEMLNQQTLGDIKAAIPYNEAQVQLALAQAVASLSTQGTADTQYLSGQNQNAALAAANANALIARDIAGVDTNVDRTAAATQVAIRESERNILSAMSAQTIADLNQRLTVAQLENAENRAIQREQNNSHNMTVTVNQAQAQQQLQAQRQDFLLNTLVNGFGQLAKATNSNVVVGSTGVGTQQNANPTNVNA